MSQPVHVVCPHCLTINRVPQARLAAGPRCGRCHQSLFTGEPVVLDGATLARHAERSDLPLLVDFWAPWCGPCRLMAPVLERAAAELEPRVRVGKLDTEQHPEAAARFGIRSIPTLVLLRHGSELARTSGAMSREQLHAWVDRVLAQAA